MASDRRPFLVLAILACAVPRVARSDTPTAAEKETARALMDGGHAQRDAGHHEAALSLFQGADAIMHVPTTGLEVAREQLALGHLVEARDTVQAVLRSPATDNEPEAFRVARRAATALDEDLVRRIPALRIRVAGSPTRVTVDGTPIPLQALVAPFKVNPGHHVVVATTETGDARLEVDVTEGQTAPADLVAPAAKPEPVAPAPPVAAGVQTDPEADSSSGPAVVPWLRWGGVGLAAVGIGVGTVTGVMAIGAKNSAEKGCVDGMCPPATWSDLDSARTASTVSTIAFSAAGAGAALVLVSFLLPPGKPAASASVATSNGRTLIPWLGPAGAALRGSF
jgi:hypothetical protein